MAAGAEHVVCELATRPRKVLAVVEYEQQLFRAEVVEEPVEGGDVWPFGNPERLRDRCRHARAVHVRRHVDQPDATRPGSDLTCGRFQRQPGLPGAADSGQRDEAMLSQQPLELVELLVATDEARELRGEVVPFLGGRWTSDLVAQNRALERSQLLARLETELFREERSSPPVGGECVRFALGAVEGQHQLAPQALAERFLSDKAFELRDERGVPAQRELSLDALFDANEAELVEASGLEREDAAVPDVGERRAAPQGESGAETLRGEPRGAASKRFAALAEKSFEAAYIEPVGLDLEDVTRRARNEPILAERGAQARDIYAESALGAGWRRLMPELLDQAIGRNRPTRLEEEQCEEGALFSTAQSQRLTIPHDFYRAEHPELGGRDGKICHVSTGILERHHSR